MKVFDLKNFDKLDFFGISKKNHFNRKCMRFHEKICVNFFVPISADWSCVVSFYIDKKMKTNFANILLSIDHKIRMSKKIKNPILEIHIWESFILLQIAQGPWPFYTAPNLALFEPKIKKARIKSTQILLLLHTKLYRKKLEYHLDLVFRYFF